MTGAAAELDKSGTRIQEMFGAVAPRYDLLNHLLSGSLDVLWRRRAAAELDPGPGDRMLDLCCGTGDQAIALGKRGAVVVAADFCLPMLALAERKYDEAPGKRPSGLAGDALRLPFASRHFAGATAAFGLRNVADLDAALAEVHRVLAPGGKAAFLEFALPRSAFVRGLYLFYFRRVLPLIGRLVSPRGSAYTYLPESVGEFPQRDGFLERMAAAGFGSLAWRDLSGGTVCLYTGTRGE